jgi:hypothetical protein
MHGLPPHWSVLNVIRSNSKPFIRVSIKGYLQIYVISATSSNEGQPGNNPRIYANSVGDYSIKIVIKVPEPATILVDSANFYTF